MSEGGIAKIMLKTEENTGNILCYKNNVVYLQNKVDRTKTAGWMLFTYTYFICVLV